jgi:exosome complex exonuclease DIS3/RRP44
VSQEDIIVSHRLGKRSDTGDRHRVVIVRFSKVTVRDGVIRARRRLRNTNGSTEQIYVNEDLTQRRAAFAGATRQMKKNHRINDCWTYNGKIVVKTLTNIIKVINTEAEINNLR